MVRLFNRFPRDADDHSCHLHRLPTSPPTDFHSQLRKLVSHYTALDIGDKHRIFSIRLRSRGKSIVNLATISRWLVRSPECPCRMLQCSCLCDDAHLAYSPGPYCVFSATGHSMDHYHRFYPCASYDRGFLYLLSNADHDFGYPKGAFSRSSIHVQSRKNQLDHLSRFMLYSFPLQTRRDHPPSTKNGIPSIWTSPYSRNHVFRKFTDST